MKNRECGRYSGDGESFISEKKGVRRMFYVKLISILEIFKKNDTKLKVTQEWHQNIFEK